MSPSHSATRDSEVGKLLNALAVAFGVADAMVEGNPSSSAQLLIDILLLNDSNLLRTDLYLTLKRFLIPQISRNIFKQCVTNCRGELIPPIQLVDLIRNMLRCPSGVFFFDVLIISFRNTKTFQTDVISIITHLARLRQVRSAQV